MGKGADYLYHGQNNFVGVHTHDTLKISTKENGVIRMRTPKEIFPEYYLIRVNEFNQTAKTPLEEWLDYLKNGHIKDDTTAPGLQEAREKLQYLMLNKKDRSAYDEHVNAIMIQNDVLGNARLESLAEGRAEEKYEIARKMKQEGMKAEVISKLTGLSFEEISAL